MISNSLLNIKVVFKKMDMNKIYRQQRHVYLPIYVKTQRESPNLIESIMFSTRKRRRSSRIALFNFVVALFAISLTRSGAIVTSIPICEIRNDKYIQNLFKSLNFYCTNHKIFMQSDIQSDRE